MEFHQAQADDLPRIVAMLADDTLGATRENPASGSTVAPAYAQAFREITADPNNELIVAWDNGAIVGVFQLTFIPNLTFEGGRRAQIEGVRVASSERGQGIGEAMIGWAIARAREKGCRMVQLTSNKERPDAIRFYEGLGFQATHEGMKLYLET